MRRELILHAGTHKTASTYIQARLKRNRDRLSAHGIVYAFPEGDTTFKRLSKAIGNRDWSVWHDYLRQTIQPDHHLLISAEQLGSRLTERRVIARLSRIARVHGLRLRVVIFIRSQLDYINSRYAYSLKRFYHTEPFESFVSAVLQGRLPSSEAFSGEQRQRHDVFDFWNYFRHLRRARCKGLTVNFIPFRQTVSDPFDQLLLELGLSPGNGWTISPERSRNPSPGIRGIYLARELGLRLKQAGIPARRIHNSSAVITKEEGFRGWDDSPYWGFTPELATLVSSHFKRNNQRFAHEIWGRDWHKVYQQDAALLNRERCEYKPNRREQERMERIADHLFKRLHRRLKPRPLHGWREPLERLSFNLIDTISFRSRHLRVLRSRQSISRHGIKTGDCCLGQPRTPST